jgi:LacI family transcriptional regulator
MKNITIKDIARQSGVSTATVSRVLNNSPNVSSEVRDKILKVIEESGYRPSRAARELKNKRSKTIALLIADGTNEYYFQIAQAIIHAIRDDGYTLFICNSFNDNEIERNYLLMLSEMNIDGLVINSCGGNDNLIVDISKTTPTILIHRRINSPNFIGDFTNADFGISTYEMTMELIRNNHSKIGIICGPTQFSSFNERLQNFQRAMASIDVEVDKNYAYFQEGPHDSSFGYEAMENFIKLPDPPTAVIATHNESCIGALRCCRDKGISIPQKLSIAAPCNVNLCDLFYVQITYALPDTWALGFRIGIMLLERIKEKNQLPNREAIYIPRIIEGKSISPPMENTFIKNA